MGLFRFKDLKKTVSQYNDKFLIIYDVDWFVVMFRTDDVNSGVA